MVRGRAVPVAEVWTWYRTTSAKQLAGTQMSTYPEVDQPIIDLCSCAEFAIWYAEAGMRVCACGHRDIEHVNGKGTCIGEIKILPGH
jgi:hypothetical protein